MKVLIIGGGPGGAVAAAALARAGNEAHVFERAAFPRFQIGESLLPCNLPVYHSIGLTHEDFVARGFRVKHAAFFESADGAEQRRFCFADGLDDDPPHAYQVERASFDAMLLDHARSCGAIVHQPAQVTALACEHDVVVTLADGSEHHGEFIIDASGRAAVLARHFGLVHREHDLMRGAVYGHVQGVDLPDTAADGDIAITMADDGWAWHIPLPGDKSSVGLVLAREQLRGGGDAAAVFTRGLGAFPALAERLAGRIPEQVHATPDISYGVRRRFGSRWAVVGDAGGFVDPVFSSGVLLSTRGARNLADALIERGVQADLNAWSDACDHDLRVFTGFIRLWYEQQTIQRLFFAQSREQSIYRGIVSLLAGNTTHPDNVFLGMLLRRIEKQRAG